MKKTDLFTIMQLGPIGEGEVIFRFKDQYVVGKIERIEYAIEAGNYATFKVQGFLSE